MIESVRKNPKLWMLTVYLFLVSGLLMWKPSLAFDKDGHIRPFGTGKKVSTIFPLWLWVLSLAVVSYLAVFMLLQQE